MRGAALLGPLVLLATQAGAQVTIPEMQVSTAESWEPYRACLAEHASTVEQVIPSLIEGADYIAEVLCEQEAAALTSEVSRRLYFAFSGQTEFNEQGYAEMEQWADTPPYLVRRAAKAWIFEARKQRLGL